MKILVRALLLLILPGLGKTQVTFCPPGAEWHFSFTDYYPSPFIVNETVKYTAFSIENGDTVKTLQHKKFFLEVNYLQINSTSIKQKGDTVFMRNSITGNQWQILYNFAATAGQTWTNSFSSSTPNYTTQVNSVTTTSLGNKLVKQLNVSYYNKNSFHNFYSGTITEHIGSQPFLFNYDSNLNGMDGDYFLEALCYQDSQLGLQQFSAKPCNYANLLGLKTENLNQVSITLSPNPTQDQFKIQLGGELPEQSLLKLCITDISGRILKQESIEVFDGECTIETSHIPSGIYQVCLSGNKTNLLMARLAISR